MVWTWVILVFLLFVNAFYVASEFAAVSLRRSRLQLLAEEGSTKARNLLAVVNDSGELDRYVAASQIGITLSSLILGAYGQATLAFQLAPVVAGATALEATAAYSASAIMVLVGLTSAQVVFGELMPKTLALHDPVRIGLLTVRPMRWSLTAYSFFITVLNGSALKLLKALGRPIDGHRHIHSPDEIDLLIAESKEGGLLDPEEHVRLHRALRLASRPVRHLMIPRPALSAIDVDTPQEEILAAVAESPYTRLPVYEGTIDKVVGIVHTRDVVLHFVESDTVPPLREVMKPVLVVAEDLMVEEFLTLLRERGESAAIVGDEYGGVAGFLTLEDVLTEVLGEVADEFETDEPLTEALPDGRVRLSGMLLLDHAEEWTGVAWRGESDTVGGLVFDTAGDLPAPGDRIMVDGVEVEVETVADNRIVSVLVTPVKPEGEDRRG